MIHKHQGTPIAIIEYFDKLYSREQIEGCYRRIPRAVKMFEDNFGVIEYIKMLMERECDRT